jgi:hypothetical protein
VPELCKNCSREIYKCRCGPNCPVWRHTDTSETYCSFNRAEPEIEMSAEDFVRKYMLPEFMPKPVITEPGFPKS